MRDLEEKRDVKVPYHDEFTVIGDKLASMLLQAAEDQVTESANLLKSTKVVAEGIKAQIKEHQALLEDIHGRLDDFGKAIQAAHHRYLNGNKPDVPVGENKKSS